MTILTTPRLLLRPFEEGDAAELYDYARDPRVGPIAGWPPHTSVENSREIIRTVFSAHNVFAVADRESGRVIGSAGFVGEHREELPGPDDELGYALSPAFWGRGLIPEASGALSAGASRSWALRPSGAITTTGTPDPAGSLKSAVSAISFPGRPTCPSWGSGG